MSRIESGQTRSQTITELTMDTEAHSINQGARKGRGIA